MKFNIKSFEIHELGGNLEDIKKFSIAMEKEQLKLDIKKRIEQIEDVHMLNAIQSILNSLENEQIDIHQVNDVLEKEDFNGYIKEWVKNM
ncbi:MAG: hypothetical protein HKN90_08675 [Flavobacteriaceae bacterium]|nr:hypothetical protein [Flavobacteriaceae bacterium]